MHSETTHIEIPDPQGAQGKQKIPLPDPAASLIHDLGNLIQIASSAVNIVSRSSGVQPDLAPVLSGARLSLQKAAALVRQTIGAARGHISPDETVSVASCLAEVVALMDIRFAGIHRVHVRASADLPMVRCDRLALQAAVLNLLYNARDAMPDGGDISIIAQTAVLPLGATALELRVVDTGVGMTPETIAHAVEPFFTTKPDGLGGVGLSMVENFATRCGGRLFIESERGAGTTVTLQLPA